MPDEYVAEPQPKVAEIQPLVVVYTAVAGLVVGVIVWILTLLISNYIIDPLFCRVDSTNFSVCAQGGILAGNLATAVGAIAGLIALVRLSVFRPMLIAIAAAITLWGATTWVGALDWYIGLVLVAIMYGLAYATFTWLSQIRSFVIALIAIIVVIAAARILPIL